MAARSLFQKLAQRPNRQKLAFVKCSTASGWWGILLFANPRRQPLGLVVQSCYNTRMQNEQAAQAKDSTLLSRADIHAGDVQAHLERITQEFRDGFEFLKDYPRSVTIFGSSVAKQDSEPCLNAEALASRIAKDLGYAVITGGGPGVMEAANRGAYKADGVSLGFNVSLPHEHFTNPYVRRALKFSYFFSRKTMLAFAAEAYVFFPGGFGTFDELFSILTLIQTRKIPHVPVILFGSSFWDPVIASMTSVMIEKYRTISKNDFALFTVTDSLDEAIDIIRKAPVSEWWRNIN